MTASQFSSKVPNLQLVWDATTLNGLMFCPTFYKNSYVDGWRPKDTPTDLAFGGFFASSIERYKKGRLDGMLKDEALLAAVKYVWEATWDIPRDMGWGGEYQEQWRCTGTEPYKNKKGNKAKCPWSHKGVWTPGEGPGTCGECGSPTETETHYLPYHKTKHRKSLIRLVVWYVEDQPENLRDGLAPITLADGTAAVELSFKLPLPFKTQDGEPYTLAGHLDDISSLGKENFIADNKTTTQFLGDQYWAKYSPNTQVDTYDLMGSVLFPHLDLRGVVIDAAQVLVDGARFGRSIFRRTDPLREEWLRDIGEWLSLAERYARANHWPMNKASCWKCPFKSVCRMEPSKRQAVLEANFEKRHWNPLEER